MGHVGVAGYLHRRPCQNRGCRKARASLRGCHKVDLLIAVGMAHRVEAFGHRVVYPGMRALTIEVDPVRARKRPIASIFNQNVERQQIDFAQTAIPLGQDPRRSPVNAQLG